jgi:hypothetical protein
MACMLNWADMLELVVDGFDERRFEGRWRAADASSPHGSRIPNPLPVFWCPAAGCTCLRFADTRSPVEFGPPLTSEQRRGDAGRLIPPRGGKDLGDWRTR